MLPVDAKLERYRELTEAPGVPGYEYRVRAIMERNLTPLGELLADNLGSVVAHRVGAAGGPRILVLGHLDEVGFMVTYVGEKGFIKFTPLGGWWDQVLLAQRVEILTSRGALPGVVGSKPVHILSAEERTKIVKMKDMFIDIGCTSREEAEQVGVRPGDPVVPICPLTVMPNPRVLMAKAWDNRAGCAAVIELLEHLRESGHPNEVFAGASVQEETGLRGALTIANKVRPDVSIALDVGVAGDTPGIREDEALSRLGKGPTVVIYDATMIPNLRLRDLVVDTARAEGIPIQFDYMPGGGTDAGRVHIQDEGIPSIVIGFPTRYIHSHASLIHRDDLEQGARLAAAVIQRLDAATVATLKQPY